jgi:hypothetical protein
MKYNKQNIDGAQAETRNVPQEHRLTAPAQNARLTRGSASMSSSATLRRHSPAIIIGRHFGRVAQALCEMFFALLRFECVPLLYFRRLEPSNTVTHYIRTSEWQ